MVGFHAGLAYIFCGMTMHDLDKERWRLSRLYGSMTEGEVEKLAADAGSLSEAAKWALKMDLSRRGLKTKLEEAGPLPKAAEAFQVGHSPQVYDAAGSACGEEHSRLGGHRIVSRRSEHHSDGLVFVERAGRVSNCAFAKRMSRPLRLCWIKAGNVHPMSKVQKSRGSLVG